MRALTLRQPWASLCVHERMDVPEFVPLKGWETRSWRPSQNNHRAMNESGLLIHSAGKFVFEDHGKLQYEPFNKYGNLYRKPSVGAIIGWVRVGRIIPTTEWMREFKPGKNGEDATWENYHFGDFAPGRWAWELLEPLMFKTPIKFLGTQSLWEYHEFIDIYRQ